VARLLVLKTILSARDLLTLIKRFSGVCRTAMVSSEGGERHPRSPWLSPRVAPSVAPPRLGFSLTGGHPMPWHRRYDPIQVVAMGVGVMIVVVFAFGL
jgi:hypothetical protein